MLHPKTAFLSASCSEAATARRYDDTQPSRGLYHSTLGETTHAKSQLVVCETEECVGYLSSTES